MQLAVLTICALAIAFTLGWIMSREWVAHTLRTRGRITVNYEHFICTHANEIYPEGIKDER